MAKDKNRFSFSRFRTYHTCPKQHYYRYVELVETAEPPQVMPGKLFHEAVEKTLKQQDITPLFKEFERLVDTGVLAMDRDQLEYTVNAYFNYYEKDYLRENTLLVEGNIQEPLDGDDYMTVVIDQVYEFAGITVLRDIKTSLTKLKYTDMNVKENQQMLAYIPYAEQHLGVKIDAVEIDEVKFGKIQEVPYTKAGRPSSDRAKIANVLYEDYWNALCEQGLENEDMYKGALDYLEKRGHPLFNRIKAHVSERMYIDTNLDDLNMTYQLIKGDIDEADIPQYRVRGPLCNYCDYRELCDLDMTSPSDTDRDIVKRIIKETQKRL